VCALLRVQAMHKGMQCRSGANELGLWALHGGVGVARARCTC
jgi:hypothetical protein